MNLEQIESLLRAQLQLSELKLSANDSHLDIMAVSESFEGLRSVKRQQAIYAPINELIADGTIHAVNIKSFTPSEWRKYKMLNG